jgi:hypothetical protein
MWMEEDKREKNDGRRMRMRNGGVMHVTVAGWEREGWKTQGSKSKGSQSQGCGNEVRESTRGI